MYRHKGLKHVTTVHVQLGFIEGPLSNMTTISLNKNNSGQPSYALLIYLLESFIAVKRIMQEAKELANDPCTDYIAAPLEV